MNYTSKHHDLVIHLSRDYFLSGESELFQNKFVFRQIPAIAACGAPRKPGPTQQNGDGL